MLHFTFRIRSAHLLCALVFLGLYNAVDASLVRRHDNGVELPAYLQSHWHTTHLDKPTMSPEEAMAYYFPTLGTHDYGSGKRNCSPDDGGGDGSNSGNGTDGNSGGGSNGGSGGDGSTTPGNYSLRNFNTISSIYNLTVYPKNVPLFLNQTDIGLPFFNENVTGRVTPLGNFSGYEDNIEYFWGLAPIPVDPFTFAISQAKVTQFTSGCPEVAASTVELTVTNVVGPNNGTFVTKLKEIAFWRFDTNGRIIAYDAWIPNLADFVAKTSNSTAIFRGGDPMPSATDEAITEAQICQVQDVFCTGGNQVYSNVTDCIEQVSAKPYGSYDETWGDNVVCRRIHVLLTPIRPAVHCAHVGPTGGGKCVDIDYNDVYFDDQELFGSTSLFRCPGDFIF